MESINISIMINSPREKVFAFVADTPKLVEVWPSFVDVRNWKRGENGLASFDFTYQLLGIQIKGKSKDSEFIENETLTTITQGGLESTIKWIFKSVDGGTKFDIYANYQVNVPVISGFAERRIAGLNEVELNSMLRNLKIKLEK